MIVSTGRGGEIRVRCVVVFGTLGVFPTSSLSPESDYLPFCIFPARLGSVFWFRFGPILCLELEVGSHFKLLTSRYGNGLWHGALVRVQESSQLCLGGGFEFFLGCSSSVAVYLVEARTCLG